MRKYYTIKYYSVESSAPYHWESLVYASPGPRHRSVPFDNPPTSPAKSIGHANGLFQRSHRPTPGPVLSSMCVPLLRGKHSLEQYRFHGMGRSNAHGRPSQSPEARQQPKVHGPDIGHPSVILSQDTFLGTDAIQERSAVTVVRPSPSSYGPRRDA